MFYHVGTCEHPCIGKKTCISDVPGKPKGPLDIVDVYSDRAAILWDRPDNDGGCPITHYVVEMKESGQDWKKVTKIVQSSRMYHCLPLHHSITS